jgi:hypothetical protein
MTIRAYDGDGGELDVQTGVEEVSIVMPSTASNADIAGQYTGGNVSAASGFADGPDTQDEGGAAGSFTISGLAIDGSVTKITLESS